MKKISSLLVSLVAVLSFALMPAPLVSAATNPGDVFTGSCQANPDGLGCDGSKAATGSGIFTIIKNVIQVMLVVGGIIAVIMIIVGGMRYMTSNGEQSHVKAAKDTILYAVIGLVVTLVAYAVVYYVTRSI